MQQNLKEPTSRLNLTSQVSVCTQLSCFQHWYFQHSTHQAKQHYHRLLHNLISAAKHMHIQDHQDFVKACNEARVEGRLNEMENKANNA
ncbi:hypothetical protein LR48_Vigan2337s000100 [Vigna angularis]|nr:hypothetical protein LR48_Vigan2337s000100 [Vigna angularis]